ncbi:hypothetical protein IAQ61_011212 [Plenodomus lingam]|uniref:uncharacterized protein n=1 Tax=Leptosphaeria maculans TaxID=5022 RepID=UPI0033236D77|nr:hypothetical protein IAQ61_011212 [Plenodomus lingam]
MRSRVLNKSSPSSTSRIIWAVASLLSHGGCCARILAGGGSWTSLLSMGMKEKVRFNCNDSCCARLPSIVIRRNIETFGAISNFTSTPSADSRKRSKSSCESSSMMASSGYMARSKSICPIWSSKRSGGSRYHPSGGWSAAAMPSYSRSNC